jgi:hypothetical protein
MKRTYKESIVHWALILLCSSVLLGIYLFFLIQVNTTQAEVDALTKVVQDLREGNDALEKRNLELYEDFCQEATWLSECQRSVQSLNREDLSTVEYITDVLRIKR